MGEILNIIATGFHQLTLAVASMITLVMLVVSPFNRPTSMTLLPQENNSGPNTSQENTLPIQANTSVTPTKKQTKKSAMYPTLSPVSTSTPTTNPTIKPTLNTIYPETSTAPTPTLTVAITIVPTQTPTLSLSPTPTQDTRTLEGDLHFQVKEIDGLFTVFATTRSNKSLSTCFVQIFGVLGGGNYLNIPADPTTSTSCSARFTVTPGTTTDPRPQVKVKIIDQVGQSKEYTFSEYCGKACDMFEVDVNRSF